MLCQQTTCSSGRAFERPIQLFFLSFSFSFSLCLSVCASVSLSLSFSFVSCSLLRVFLLFLPLAVCHVFPLNFPAPLARFAASFGNDVLVIRGTSRAMSCVARRVSPVFRPAVHRVTSSIGVTGRARPQNNVSVRTAVYPGARLVAGGAAGPDIHRDRVPPSTVGVPGSMDRWTARASWRPTISWPC